MGRVAVQLNRDKINSVAKALPDAESKQMLKEEVVTGAGKDNTASEEDRPADPLARVRSGEEYSRIFFEGQKAFSRVQEQIYAFFTESTIDSREWAAALVNLNMGKGFGHLILTIFIAALLIFAGLGIEWLLRRATEGLRRQILDTASLGRFQFLGRVVSRLFLNLLGFGTYVLIQSEQAAEDQLARPGEKDQHIVQPVLLFDEDAPRLGRRRADALGQPEKQHGSQGDDGAPHQVVRVQGHGLGQPRDQGQGPHSGDRGQ